MAFLPGSLLLIFRSEITSNQFFFFFYNIRQSIIRNVNDHIKEKVNLTQLTIGTVVTDHSFSESNFHPENVLPLEASP